MGIIHPPPHQYIVDSNRGDTLPILSQRQEMASLGNSLTIPVPSGRSRESSVSIQSDRISDSNSQYGNPPISKQGLDYKPSTTSKISKGETTTEKEIIKSYPIHENLLRGLRRYGKPSKETEEITRAFLILLGEKKAATAVCRFSLIFCLLSVVFYPFRSVG